MARPLTILIVDDNPDDAQLLVRELKRADFEPQWQRASTEQEFLERLHSGLDLVLSDQAMPEFSGLRALELLKASGLEVPFIIVSGTIGEDTAVAAIKRGAADYLLKDRLARLGSAVANAVEESRSRRERKKANEALRLFRTLMDQSNDTLEIIDPETGRYLDVNEKGPQELGCTRAEYLSLRVCDVDPTFSEEMWPQLMMKIRETGSLSGEGVHRRKDGTTFPIEFNARWARLDRDYIVSVIRDISLRKESELALRASQDRFRELAENIHEVFWISNPDKSQMFYVSPAYEKIWGRNCESLYLASCFWFDAIRPDDRAKVLQASETKQETGLYDEEYRIVRPDGSERWIRDRAFPVRGAGGIVQRLVGVAEDITESKKLQEQFLRAQRMEALGTLAGGIAHDLNNILGPVLMAPALLKESVKSEHERQLLDLIENAARRGASITRQLLTFSRGMGGERASVQLRHLLKEMVDIMRETFPRDIVIEDNSLRDLRPVLGDPTQLHQVILNLCVNARDAMPDGGTLSLMAKNVEFTEEDVKNHAPARPGPHVAVSVKDTGHGIPPEIVDRIFDPFFTTKTLAKGTGLGLSTVLGIVRSHNGFITVVTVPGHGTTFTFYLPVAPDGMESEVTRDADALPLGHGELILVVDDEDPIRTAVRLLLERQGYCVLTAKDGAAAVAIFLQNLDAIRVVLTDVIMPMMAGVPLIRTLRAVEPKIKILATSGLSDPVNLAELKTIGINQILEKPCDPRTLLEAIATQLRGDPNAQENE